MKRIVLLFSLMIPMVVHATVTDQSFSVSYTCTGTTGPFSFSFPISDPGSLTVVQNGTTVPSSGYTIAPINNNYTNGGTVNLNVACPNGQTLVLERTTPLTQTTVYTDNMPVPMKTFERSLDKATEIDQEIAGSVSSRASPGACSLPNVVESTTNSGVTCVQPSNTTGNSATASSLASTPSHCGSGQAANGVDASGNATGCFTPSVGGLSVGTSPISGGTNGSLLYDNSGVLGNESLASLLISPPAIGTGTYNDAFFSHLQAYTTLSAASFNTATSGSNTQSAPFHMTADYWTGSGSTPDDWEMQNVPAAGTNPPDTLVISHTGASVAHIQIPASSGIAADSGGSHSDCWDTAGGIISGCTGGGSGPTFATPYITSGGTSYDSNFTPVVKITGTTLHNIDLASDLVDGSGNSDYTMADSTGLLHGTYPNVTATNGDVEIVGGYNNEAQTHWMENVTGKTSATLNASILSVGTGGHSANVGVMFCDTVNHVMASFEMFGNNTGPAQAFIVVWQSNFNMAGLGYTECAANYPLTGFWNQGSCTVPACPIIVAAPLDTQYIDPSNLYFRWVYHPTTIPGPISGSWGSGTITGPGYTYEYSRDGVHWAEAGTICASGCAVNQAVGAPTQFGILTYTGNRSGWYGTSIIDWKSFNVQ